MSLEHFLVNGYIAIKKEKAAGTGSLQKDDPFLIA